MGEIKNLELAKATFATLCQTLEHNDWKYHKFEEKLTIECGARGDDFPIEFKVEVDAERMLVVLLSPMPVKVEENKRVDMVVAVSAVNNMLVDGCFDFDISTGNMFFRMSNSFIESTLGEEVFAYMLYGACHIIDEYNDKFLMIAKDMLSIENFLAQLQN